ncbi:MAG TPA: signal peptide peptidase SppA [Candidatus Saccharimonadales bacterium]|nr:signal peptide peptidase SppA [Candidatus Saccharimonadales bacterium]
MAKFTDYLKNIFWILLILQFASPVFKTLKKTWSSISEPKNKVGLVNMQSVILSSHRWNKQLKKFFKDSDIKAILIKLDSPGGAAGSSQAICHEILQLKKQYPKPIIAYTENVCASGAYYIAAATDHIIATPSSLVGSIGAKINTQFKVKELLKDWKIQTHDISAGDYKNSLDPFTDLTEEQKTMLKNLVGDCYDQFANDIAAYRHLPIDQKDTWANGKVFTGNDALKLKLVDELGNQTVALEYLKKQILHSDREIELVKVKAPSTLHRLFHSNDCDADDDDDDEVKTSISDTFANSFWHSFFVFTQKQGINF